MTPRGDLSLEPRRQRDRRSRWGSARTRMPVACQTALAMAPAEPVMPISPTPLMPERIHVGGRASSIIKASSRWHVGVHRNPVFREVGIHDPPGAGSMIASSCRAKDMPQIIAAINLALHHAGIDHASCRERADQASDADLAQIRIDLDLGEHRAMRVHGVVRLRRGIAGALAAGFDLRARPARLRISP